MAVASKSRRPYLIGVHLVDCLPWRKTLKRLDQLRMLRGGGAATASQLARLIYRRERTAQERLLPSRAQAPGHMPIARPEGI